MGRDGLHIVGKIDKKIFSCISPDIMTDDVIITDERITHIMERHPGDYEQIQPFFADALSSPDYIIKDTREHTGLLLKHVEHGELRFQLVLRIQTCEDPQGYQHSILTGWRIRKDEWDRLLRNKKILYKME